MWVHKCTRTSELWLRFVNKWRDCSVRTYTRTFQGPINLNPPNNNSSFYYINVFSYNNWFHFALISLIYSPTLQCIQIDSQTQTISALHLMLNTHTKPPQIYKESFHITLNNKFQWRWITLSVRSANSMYGRLSKSFIWYPGSCLFYKEIRISYMG